MKLTSGRGPTGIAAAATYIATVLTNERKTQREIAEIANVTEVTIRNRYKELLERLFIEVPALDVVSWVTQCFFRLSLDFSHSPNSIVSSVNLPSS